MANPANPLPAICSFCFFYYIGISRLQIRIAPPKGILPSRKVKPLPCLSLLFPGFMLRISLLNPRHLA